MADEQTTVSAGNPDAGTGAEEAREDFDGLPDDILESLDGGNAVGDEDEGGGEGSSTVVDSTSTATSAAGGTTTSTVTAQSSTVVSTTVVPANETPEAKAAREEAARKVLEQPQQQVPTETPEQKAAREAEDKRLQDEWTSNLEKFYEIPEADRGELMVNPEKVLPKLAAKMHAQVFKDATQAALRLVTAAMPGLIKLHTDGGQREDKARTEFYTRYPVLNKPEYHDKVLAAGRMYRQLKPDATPDDVMENMALLASKALGVEHTPYTPSQTTPPAKPAKQPRPANAGGGSQPASSTTAKKGGDTEWADLANDDE